MTLKDKKNKREYEKKQKNQGNSKDNEKPSKSKENSKPNKAVPLTRPEPESGATSSNFQGVAENADKLISDANQRYLAAETAKEEEVDAKYAKRNITSNWTKYELPSSEEDAEDETSQSMTGADFEYVMSSAQGAESHFRLKSEKEWETHTENLGEPSEEFFSLDLTELERSVSSIPLHKQVCLEEDQFDKDMLDRLVKKAEAVREGSLEASAQVEEVISQKILDILNIGKTEKPKELLTSELKQTIIPRPEALQVKEEDTKPDGVLEQRQNKRRSRGKASGETDIIENRDVSPQRENTKDIVKVAAPLDQRPNRRQRGAKIEINEPDKTGGDEEKDLEFLENLEKDSQVDTDAYLVSSKPVVPVTIVGEDTQNLEDWLDDFLDE